MIDDKTIDLFCIGYNKFDFTREDARIALNKYADRILVYRTNGDPVFMTMYLMINDLALFHITATDAWKILGNQAIEIMMLNPGKHAHFIWAVGQGMPYAINAIKDVRNMHKPLTVSWCGDDNKLHVIGGRK